MGSPHKAVKRQKKDQSLSMMSRDYSIESIDSYDESMRGHEKRDRTPMESHSSINIGPASKRPLNPHERSLSKDVPGASQGLNQKRFGYKRQMTNVVST